MKLSEKLQRIGSDLASISDNVYHYKRPPNLSGCIVWAESEESDSFSGDGGKEQALTGFIDYWTKTEYDPIVDKIQDVLDSDDHVEYELSAVQYEDETGLIHFTFQFWVA